MDTRDAEILRQFAETVVSELQAVVGSFAPSVRYGIGGNALVIDGHPHIGVLNYGRGPTRSGAQSSGKPLRELILEWINRHSIQPRNDDPERPMSKETLAFIISRSIHRNGTRLYQEIKRGAKPRDVFGNILTQDRIDNLLSLLSGEYEQRVVNDLMRVIR